MAIRLADALVYLGAERDRSFDRELDRGERETRSWGQRVGNAIATSVTGAIIGAATAATAAITGIAFAGWNVATDIDDAVRHMQASLGLTRLEARDMAMVIREVYGQNFGESIADVGATVETVFAGLGDAARDMAEEDLALVTAQALQIRDVFGIDVSESVRTVSVLMRTGLAGSAQEAFDIIVAGMQNGLNVSGDLIDTLIEYSDDFADLGLTGSETLALLNTGLEAGAFNTDKLADAINEFGVNLRDPAVGESIAAIDTGIFNIYTQFQNGEITEREALLGMIERLNAIQDPIAQDQAGVLLFRSMWEDMGASAILALGDTRDNLVETEGATDSLNVTGKSLGSRWQSMLRRIELALEPVGVAMMDLAEKIMPAVEAFITNELIPGIENLGHWLQKELPLAAQEVRNWFENTLLPALRSVWSFISTQLVPGIQNLVGHLGDIGNTISTITGLFMPWLNPTGAYNAMITTVSGQGSGKQGKTYQEGGFTGPGPAEAIAGVVHHNEFVVPEGGALVLREGERRSTIGTLNVIFNGAEAPTTRREAETSADLLIEALRQKGFDR